MSQTNIEFTNTLIAKGIGLKKDSRGWIDVHNALGLGENYICSNLLFHQSYEWLMPVVETIGEHEKVIIRCGQAFLDSCGIICSDDHVIENNQPNLHHAIYLSVVDFFTYKLNPKEN